MKSTEIEIRGVCERDIDLLLLEELVASPAFLRFFLSAVDIPARSRLLLVARSVNTSNGESDLELTVDEAGKRRRVLVENKVDAALQDRQGERYSERAAAYVATGECDVARTVLIAPRDYTASEGFDRRVNYEDVLDWFETEGESSERSRWKAALLREAIQRSADGWVLVPHERTTGWWQRYWELATALAPELGMPQPGVKPATSFWIRFCPVALRNGVFLLHKLPYGRVDLSFKGKGDEAEQFEVRYGKTLSPGMIIARAGKSLAVRVMVPRIQISLPFEECEAEVREGIRAARMLLQWYVKEQPRVGSG